MSQWVPRPHPRPARLRPHRRTGRAPPSRTWGSPRRWPPAHLPCRPRRSSQYGRQHADHRV